MKLFIYHKFLYQKNSFFQTGAIEILD